VAVSCWSVAKKENKAQTKAKLVSFRTGSAVKNLLFACGYVGPLLPAAIAFAAASSAFSASPGDGAFISVSPIRNAS
jgi:hypothetical protein